MTSRGGGDGPTDSPEDDGQSDCAAVVREVIGTIREYGTHTSYIEHVLPGADDRTASVTESLRSAFQSFIRREEADVIDFENQTPTDLAEALLAHPIILKSILALCNIAGRAIERDLDLKNIDTYGLRLTRDQANQIAGFVKSFLPPSVSVATLVQIDRNAYFDKEIRAHKGRWENSVTSSLSTLSGLLFKKTKFSVGRESFELDSAYRSEETIPYAVDVKRIEARRDIHKRADEIANKAIKFKETYPESKFGAMIYYPFISEHGNIRERLSGAPIDFVAFASESTDSIDNAVLLMLARFGISEPKL